MSSTASRAGYFRPCPPVGGADPREVVVVGDTPYDVALPGNAGSRRWVCDQASSRITPAGEEPIALYDDAGALLDGSTPRRSPVS